MIIDVGNKQWAKFLSKVWPVMRDELANYVSKCGSITSIRIYSNELVDKETSNYFIRTHGFMSSIPGLVHLDIKHGYKSTNANYPGFLQGYLNLKTGVIFLTTDSCPDSDDFVVAFVCHIDPRQPLPVPKEL